MKPSAPIVVVDDLADGFLEGFSIDGTLIVCMRYMPTFERLVGTEGAERNVMSWHVSPGGARRIASIAAWNASDNPTAGYA